MIIKANKRFQKIFSDYVKKSNTTTYSSSNYGGGYYGGGYYPTNPSSSAYHIYFYEWSTLRNGAKSFSSLDTFKAYCGEHKIMIPVGFSEHLEKNHWIWCTCIPGQAKLMWDKSYADLSQALGKARIEYESNKDKGEVINLPCVANHYY